MSGSLPFHHHPAHPHHRHSPPPPPPSHLFHSIPSRRFIAILDIFGFESLETNSLEQLLINHTNEKLQLYFVENTLKAEMALYESEGVPAPNVSLDDNSACVELVEGRSKTVSGLVWLLEDECAKPKTTDESLVAVFEHDHASHASLAKAAWRKGEPISKTRFAIAHYAGTVEYDASGFLTKNAGALTGEMEVLLKGSSMACISAVGAATAEESGIADGAAAPPKENAPPTPAKKGRGRRQSVAGGGGKKKGLAGAFTRQLEALVLTLRQTTPHYVRCVKPNEKQAPAAFEPSFVLHQLRCGGTPQLLTLMGRGFPTRCAFDALATRYQPLLPALGASLAPREFVDALLSALEMRAATATRAPAVTASADELSELGAPPTRRRRRRRRPPTAPPAPRRARRRRAGGRLRPRRSVRLLLHGAMATLDALLHGTPEEAEALTEGAAVHHPPPLAPRRDGEATLRLRRTVVARRNLDALARRASVSSRCAAARCRGSRGAAPPSAAPPPPSRSRRRRACRAPPYLRTRAATVVVQTGARALLAQGRRRAARGGGGGGGRGGGGERSSAPPARLSPTGATAPTGARRGGGDARPLRARVRGAARGGGEARRRARRGGGGGGRARRRRRRRRRGGGGPMQRGARVCLASKAVAARRRGGGGGRGGGGAQGGARRRRSASAGEERRQEAGGGGDAAAVRVACAPPSARRRRRGGRLRPKSRRRRGAARPGQGRSPAGARVGRGDDAAVRVRAFRRAAKSAAAATPSSPPSGRAARYAARAARRGASARGASPRWLQRGARGGHPRWRRGAPRRHIASSSSTTVRFGCPRWSAPVPRPRRRAAPCRRPSCDWWRWCASRRASVRGGSRGGRR